MGEDLFDIGRVMQKKAMTITKEHEIELRATHFLSSEALSDKFDGAGKGYANINSSKDNGAGPNEISSSGRILPATTPTKGGSEGGGKVTRKDLQEISSSVR